MEILITVMIFLGSALMVYNIVRFAGFIKRLRDLERTNTRMIRVLAPLALLVFFLLAYIAVGVLGLADLLVAAILLGGSVFVFLFESLIFSAADRVKDTQDVLSARYEEMQQELAELTRGDNATFRVNLTTDEVEERHGKFLYDSDLECSSYSDLIQHRKNYMIDIERNSQGEAEQRFTREALLKAYHEGQTHVTEEILARRNDGETAFVLLEASMTKMPVSGEVIAFVTERPYNEDVVRRALLEKVLMDQYDRIIYMIDGLCRVLISNIGKKEGLLFCDDETDSYESLYLNVILPPLVKPRGRATDHPLRLSAIDKALSEQDTYVVEQLFRIGGELRRKRFSFYCIDRGAKFYLMLLSDTTGGLEITLPEDAAEASAPEQPETVPEPDEAPAETEERLFGEGLHVLVADDNEMNREIAELLLGTEGYEVDLAVNGAEALQRVAEAAPGTYDLILMDVNMPVMGGYEATAAIRALDPERAGVPIVALSASDAEEDMRSALARGMDAYATKPLEMERLRETIARLLGRDTQGIH